MQPFSRYLSPPSPGDGTSSLHSNTVPCSRGEGHAIIPKFSKYFRRLTLDDGRNSHLLHERRRNRVRFESAFLHHVCGHREIDGDLQVIGDLFDNLWQRAFADDVACKATNGEARISRRESSSVMEWAYPTEVRTRLTSSRSLR